MKTTDLMKLENFAYGKRCSSRLVGVVKHPIRYFYDDAIARWVVNQGLRGIVSSWDKTDPTSHLPSISVSLKLVTLEIISLFFILSRKKYFFYLVYVGIIALSCFQKNLVICFRYFALNRKVLFVSVFLGKLI